jgi:adenosylhomocysteinase
MDGFSVMSMTEVAKMGDVFCTVTGNKSVLTKKHFDLMKDGAIISNSGPFNVEIDIPALKKMSSLKRTTRTFVEEYSLKDGARSTCWAGDASSTWPQPEGIRRR